MSPGAAMIEGTLDGVIVRVVSVFAAASAFVDSSAMPATVVEAAGEPLTTRAATPAGVQAKSVLVPASVSAVVASSIVPCVFVVAFVSPRAESAIFGMC
jgi:hypothetical protein